MDFWIKLFNKTGEMFIGKNYQFYLVVKYIYIYLYPVLQKVVFEMVDYPSPLRYESVVRTCSSGPCVPITMETFNGCRGKTRSYRFNGCAIRTCCEKDFCNKATRVFDSDFWTFLFTFILIVFRKVCLY